MFFLIVIVLIAQIIILVNIAVFALKTDIKINKSRKLILRINPILDKKIFYLKKSTFNTKEILLKLYNDLAYNRNMLILGKVLNLLEWGLFLTVQPKNRKFILGYKLSKAIVRELSSSENML